MDANGVIRVQCPAVAGNIGCARRAGTVEQAVSDGLPIVENPPSLDRDGLEPPELCSPQMKTVRIVLPEKVAKLYQPTYWGSRDWSKKFGARTYIEGVFGNFKNPSTENLRRGTTQIMGLAWTNVNLAIIAAAYNLRSLRKWQERCGEGDPNHVLLAVDPGPQPWGFLDWDQIQCEWDKFHGNIAADVGS